jgi:hypothetical protein
LRIFLFQQRLPQIVVIRLLHLKLIDLAGCIYHLQQSHHAVHRRLNRCHHYFHLYSESNHV